MFYRIHSDGLRMAVDLRHHYAGTGRATCWIIGGGPSLRAMPCDRIQLSPVPKFAVNLCGFGLIRPDIWTAYDPTARFHRSTYLDGSVLKLLPSRRATDLVPGTTHKVGDCPSTLFFERDGQRGFHNFLGDETTREENPGIADWQDSLVQAIDLAWRLGFRRLFLVGCDMHIGPPEKHVRRAGLGGVRYQPEELLRGFYDRCREAGLDPASLEADEPIAPYHFDETKSLAAALQTDFHYYRVVQYLRLSRRAMSLAGLELISATPSSRLNAFFPYRPVDDLLDDIADEIGHPAREATRGQYSKRNEMGAPPGAPMKDFRPHNWGPAPRAATTRANVVGRRSTAQLHREVRLTAAIEDLPEIEVPLQEEG
ncbi:hypothetical protein Pan44_01740 [Caulifigura coniformis]|uniref:Uncharacterized protein n=1 Tax=Caulifigura coniformis TaxID=2527983 RepID=A0A517S7R7_9PLAN|nr:hypothetical protein [Caulifigura coniformis]QDT52165.1 hypothetical protein Pan44_01740 [Caulifigura coniformis]